VTNSTARVGARSKAVDLTSIRERRRRFFLANAVLSELPRSNSVPVLTSSTAWTRGPRCPQPPATEVLRIHTQPQDMDHDGDVSFLQPSHQMLNPTHYEQVCVNPLRITAMTLPARCTPAACSCCFRSTGQTDRRTPYRYRDSHRQKRAIISSQCNLWS